MFEGCQKLKKAPQFTGTGTPISLTNMFSACYNLKDFDDEAFEASFDWSIMNGGLSGAYSNYMSNMFS
jgi:hypothetical protein